MIFHHHWDSPFYCLAVNGMVLQTGQSVVAPLVRCRLYGSLAGARDFRKKLTAECFELRRLNLGLGRILLCRQRQKIECGALAGGVADLAKQLGGGVEQILTGRQIKPAQTG